MLTIAVPLLAIRMNASPLILGFTGFFFSLFYLSFSPLFGKLSDRVGLDDRTRAFPFTVIGCIILLFSATFFPFSSSFAHIFILMGLTGIGMAMFWSPLEVWITKTSDDLLKSLSLFNVFWCAGISVGSLISGILFQINWHFPFLFIGIFYLAAIFFLYRCPRVSSTQIFHNVEDGKEKRVKDFFLHIGWIANFIAWFGIGILRYLFPKLAVTLGITPFMIGVLMFLLGATQSLIFYIMGHTSGWQHRLNFLILMQLVMCGGFLILCFSSSLFLFFPAFILFGAGVGVSYFSSLYYSLESKYEKGERSGIHELIVGAGGLVGPLLGGIAAQHFSLRAPFILCIAIMIGGIVLEKNIVKRNEKKRLLQFS